MKISVTVCLLVAMTAMCIQVSQAWLFSWGRRPTYTGSISGVPGVTRDWSVGVSVGWQFSRDTCSIVDKKIVARGQWGSAERRRSVPALDKPITVVYLFQEDSCKPGQSDVDCVKAIQAAHQRNNKIDIAYNFLIGQDATVYEGRGWSYAGNHTTDQDNDSLGVAFLGDFQKEEPNKASQNALNQLIICGKRVAGAVAKDAYIEEGAGLGKAFRAMLEDCHGLSVISDLC